MERERRPNEDGTQQEPRSERGALAPIERLGVVGAHRGREDYGSNIYYEIVGATTGK